jgi:hypothetical protein
MCGHGIIALTTVVFQTKIFHANKKTLKIDTPAGLFFFFPAVLISENFLGRVTANVKWRPDLTGIHSVSFRNVPSFLFLKVFFLNQTF